MDKICKRCKKLIAGKIKIHQYRKTIGNKSVVLVDYYDEDCFYYLNLEEANNEAKTRNIKRTVKRRP